MTQTKAKNSKSVYAPGPKEAKAESHTIAVLVKNEPGVLARVVGLFSGRGYNIDSLTVAETDHAAHLSRITIVCSGTPSVIEQIKTQLSRLIPVQDVRDLTTYGEYVGRELALVKVKDCTEDTIKKMKLEEKFQARVVDCASEFCIFEVTGEVRDIDAFIETVTPLGLINVSRTGVAAMSRGQDPIGG